MRDLVIAAYDILFHEVLLKKLPRQVLSSISTEINERFALHPVRCLTHLFLNYLKKFFSTWGMMLVLKDLGETVAGGLLNVFVTFIHKIYQHRYQIRMNFWHVK